LRWTWLAGALAWLAIGWTLLRAVTLPRAFAVAAGVAIVALVVATSVSAAQAKYPDPRIERAAKQVMPAVLAEAKQSARPVLVRGAGGIGSGALADAVLLRLQHAGIDAKFDSDLDYVVGDRHVVPASQAHTLIVAAADEFIDPVARDPRFRMIASYDSLSPADRALVTNTIAEINALPPLDRLGWPDRHPAQWKRVVYLNTHSDREAVFIGPPS
jgi:hypothetical protein